MGCEYCGAEECRITDEEARNAPRVRFERMGEPGTGAGRTYKVIRMFPRGTRYAVGYVEHARIVTNASAGRIGWRWIARWLDGKSTARWFTTRRAAATFLLNAAKVGE
jgi:hypothetical protein